MVRLLWSGLGAWIGSGRLGQIGMLLFIEATRGFVVVSGKIVAVKWMDLFLWFC